MTAEPTQQPRHIARLAALIVFVVVIIGGIAGGVLFGTQALLPEKEKTTLRVALETFGAEVLDPSMDAQVGLYYHAHMYDYLLGIGGDGRTNPALGALERWEINADGSVYTLVLRQGMKWHDGERITSEDIQFTIAHYTRQDAACAACPNLKQAVKGVEAIDRYTARIELNFPDVVFVSRFGPIEGDMPLLPKHHIEKVGTVGFESVPLGSGPWKFVRRSPGERIEYEAHLGHWNPERVPAMDYLVLLQVPEEDTRLAMLKAGTVDVVPIGPGNVEALKSEGFTMQGPKNIITTTARFLMSYHPAFLTSKPEFREALALGMDLETIVQRAYPPESGTLASGSALFRPLTDGYDQGLPPYSYRPDVAAQLLEEAGYNGEVVRLFSITAYGLTQMPGINQMIAEDWRRIGVNVEIVETDWLSLLAKLQSRPQEFRDPSVVPMFHGAAPVRPRAVLNDISRYMTDLEGTLLTYPDIEKGNRVFAQMNAIIDAEERALRLRQLNHEMYDEYWAVPITWSHDVYALSPDLEGWLPTNGVSTDLHFETIRKK